MICRGEERILQLVRQAPRQFAPRRHALGLHQPVALLGQFARHLVEGPGQLADLIARVDIDPRVPIRRCATSRAPAASSFTGRVTRAVAQADEHKRQKAAPPAPTSSPTVWIQPTKAAYSRRELPISRTPSGRPSRSSSGIA